MKEQILIGGRALVALGSSRNTQDTDYLVCLDTDKMFVSDKTNNVDYLNANGSDFFMEIWEAEKGKQMASPQSLLELKAYAFVMHCQNMNWQKADDCEYDIKFLVRKFNLTETRIVNKYLATSELKEVAKVINSVKK